MSLRFFNPPLVLLARGNSEGADIGGAVSIVAMDKKHDLHVVENIHSSLSWAGFWQELGLEDEFENFTLKHLDEEAVDNKQELIARITRAFNRIRHNGWIFYGIARFESNTFMEPFFLELNQKNIDKLKNAHKRIRNQNKFPVILEDVSESTFIASKFHGNGAQYFHYSEDRDLYSLYELTMHTGGYVAGIVCTATEAANFYIFCGNVRLHTKKAEVQWDLKTMDEAIRFIEKGVIFPVSWFRLYVGRNALETLDKWADIKENEELIFALRAYLHYINTILKEEHDKKLKKASKF
jgi:hypothetical protein